MKSGMHKGANKFLYQRARELRNNSTHAEEILWGYLRTKPLGIKFRRQHPYSVFILDFYCHSLKLVIEVDGSIHELEEVKERDKYKQEELEKDGLMVMRLQNNEIEKAADIAFKKIESMIQSLINEQKRP